MASRFESGDAEQVWHRDSGTPGPTVVILGGVHGNEPAGIEVIKRMVSGEFHVPLERGKLTVALGNLAAIDEKIRYVGRNLNRTFCDLSEEELEEQAATPPYELGRAQELKPLLDEADSTLDLHSFRAKDGAPFIITEARGFEAAQAIGPPYISSGWSTIEPGGTDGYMEQQGKIGLCYELGQLEDLKRGIPRGEEGVLRFLEHMQLIEMVRRPTGKQVEPQFIHATRSVHAEPDGFRWGPNAPYRSFQQLQPGELIAQNGTDAIRAGNQELIIFPSADIPIKAYDEMFSLGTIINSPTKSYS